MEEIKRIIKRGKIKTGIICTIIALIILAICFKDWLPIGEIQDLDTIESIDDVHEGKAKVTVTYVYDYFMYYTSDNSNNETERDFLIPVGEEGAFIGVDLSGTKNKHAYSNMEQIWNFEEMYAEYDEDDSEFEEAMDELYGGLYYITVKGHIRKMDYEEQGFLNEYLKDMCDYFGMTKEEADEYFKPYILEPNSVSMEGFGFVLAIIAGVLLIIGVCSLLSAMFGDPFKSLKEYAKKENMDKETVINKADQLYIRQNPMYNMRADDNMFLYANKSEIKVFNPKDMLWVYKSVIRNKQGAVTVSKTYKVIVRLANGTNFEMMSNEGSVDDTVMAVATLVPDIIVGYSEDLNRMYIRDRKRMIDEVARRRNERLNPVAYEQPVTEESGAAGENLNNDADDSNKITW